MLDLSPLCGATVPTLFWTSTLPMGFKAYFVLFYSFFPSKHSFITCRNNPLITRSLYSHLCHHVVETVRDMSFWSLRQRQNPTMSQNMMSFLFLRHEYCCYPITSRSRNLSMGCHMTFETYGAYSGHLFLTSFNRAGGAMAALAPHPRSASANITLEQIIGGTGELQSSFYE